MKDISGCGNSENKELSVYTGETSVLYLYNFLNKKALETHSRLSFSVWPLASHQCKVTISEGLLWLEFLKVLSDITCQETKHQVIHIKSILLSCIFQWWILCSYKFCKVAQDTQQGAFSLLAFVWDSWRDLCWKCDVFSEIRIVLMRDTGECVPTSPPALAITITGLRPRQELEKSFVLLCYPFHSIMGPGIWLSFHSCQPSNCKGF